MKKINMTLGAIFLAATLSLTGYAKESTKEMPTPPALTEEQKGEKAKQFEAEYKQMQEKFSALTDEQNNGLAAGQTVFHYHLHLIPRYEGDSVGELWTPGSLSDEQKKEIYDLYDKVNVAKIKLLDKYVELGLMTDEEAKSIQKHMSDVSEKIRSEGQFIGFKAPHFPKRAENNQQNSQDVE